MARVRIYFDEVPERDKEAVSKSWGAAKRATYIGGKKNGLGLFEGSTFNKVLTFTLGPGYYHLSSDMVSVTDIRDLGELRGKVTGLIRRMAAEEKSIRCVPLLASNICDWDTGYAVSVGADVALRETVINGCIEHKVVLTGGETANLAEQLKGTGMGWMFTLLSKYKGSSVFPGSMLDDTTRKLFATSRYLADKMRFEIANVRGQPMLGVIGEPAQFVMTADGTGSKSLVCGRNTMSDLIDALAMSGDDATRDGAFPVIASIGVHAEPRAAPRQNEGRRQFIHFAGLAAERYQIPIQGFYHESNDVNTRTVNCTILSEVRRRELQPAAKPGLTLVVLPEMQRSNGITLQRRVLEETFGPRWHDVGVSDAVAQLRERLPELSIPVSDSLFTLGALVSVPSTPYFRVDSKMPEQVLNTIDFKVNISSGGLVGKTRRVLEPLGLGVSYVDLFESPDLIMILQAASRLPESKGIITDKVAYYTWGCGNGQVIGTTHPDWVIGYYSLNGMKARKAGVVTGEESIRVTSKALDSRQQSLPLILAYRHADEPLG